MDLAEACCWQKSVWQLSRWQLSHLDWQRQVANWQRKAPARTRSSRTRSWTWSTTGTRPAQASCSGSGAANVHRRPDATTRRWRSTAAPSARRSHRSGTKQQRKTFSVWKLRLSFTWRGWSWRTSRHRQPHHRDVHLKHNIVVRPFKPIKAP